MPDGLSRDDGLGCDVSVSDLVSISELSVLPIGDAKAPEKSTSAEKKLLVEEKAAKEAPPIEVT